jgi:hypothetical protein
MTTRNRSPASVPVQHAKTPQDTFAGFLGRSKFDNQGDVLTWRKRRNAIGWRPRHCPNHCGVRLDSGRGRGIACDDFQRGTITLTTLIVVLSAAVQRVVSSALIVVDSILQ